MDAIFEATIQVLLSDGSIRLNTTRVARRAGVSVGTLYQYFPNKQALLFAVLERHLAMLADAMEKACDENLYATVETIAETVVKAYLNARMAQSEVFPALCLVAMELDARELITLAIRRSERAIEAMLSTTTDSRFDDRHVIAETITAVIYGTVPASCQRGHVPCGTSRGRKAANNHVSLLSCRKPQSGIAERTCRNPPRSDRSAMTNRYAWRAKSVPSHCRAMIGHSRIARSARCRRLSFHRMRRRLIASEWSSDVRRSDLNRGVS